MAALNVDHLLRNAATLEQALTAIKSFERSLKTAG
jgi:hypothetical protein